MTTSTVMTSSRRFGAALFVGCGAALIPLWLATYPPMVDLPQHAAQVSIWHQWNSGGFDYESVLEVNWFTPYLVTSLLAFVLSSFLPITTAFKVVISVAIVGIPLATLALLRESRGNPWWALATIPLGYGYSLYMGFAAFLFSIPLALLFLVLGWRYSERPSRVGAWAVLVALQLLFLTHTLSFGWAGLTGALVSLSKAPTFAAALRRVWPYLAALVLPLVWLAVTAFDSLLAPSEVVTRFGLHRLAELPALLLGFSKAPITPTLVGVLLLVVPFLTRGRPANRLGRWLPFAVTMLLILIVPFHLFGVSFLDRRFVVFVLPTLYFAFDPSDAPPRQGLRHFLLATLPLVWLVHVGILFHAYDKELGDLKPLIAQIEPDRRIFYMALDRNSAHIPYPVYLHSGSWYQAMKGGLVEFSFAEFFQIRYRYRPDSLPPFPEGIEWQPWTFRWHAHGGSEYDYFLVRSPIEPSDVIRRTGAPFVLLGAAEGGWWLWGRDAMPRLSSGSQVP